MRAALAGLAVVVFTFGVWIAWERYGYLVRTDPSAKLQSEALDGPGIRNVSLAQMTDFNWEHVVFFGPYTSKTQTTNALGFGWPDYDESGIKSTDFYSLIVFTESKRVIRWWKLRRCAPDIEKSFLGVLVHRKDATLLLQNNDACSYLLGPASMRSNSAAHPDAGSDGLPFASQPRAGGRER